VAVRKETRKAFLEAHGKHMQARDAPGLAAKAARKTQPPNYLHQMTIDYLLAEIQKVERDIMMLKLREKSQQTIQT
jgi:hypothetical protein